MNLCHDFPSLDPTRNVGRSGFDAAIGSWRRSSSESAITRSKDHTHWLLVLSALSIALQAEAGVLSRSDVPFMYQASRAVYEAYGATVVAWGGTPSPKAREQANEVKLFGSVGMVTEFSRYYERFPSTYEQGLCRDVNGQPVKVPWLTDHQHKGVPFWWCCTQQPQFRQYLRERVVETVKAGADGLHIDDHLGTAGGLWTGICFCERCLDGFRGYLQALPEAERTGLAVPDLAAFNYRDYVRQWLAKQDNRKPGINERPLWRQWQAYQCREAARFMQELHELANQTAGHPMAMSANAGVLWPLHLVDYQTLDFFCAEIEHGASRRAFSDLPILAYRLADAMGRPLTASASGQDWAFIQEHKLPGLVRGWIAASYAAGNFLMAPHHQWCYTEAKGTHWYEGPTEQFAPLYQFVRQNASLFDNYETYADLAVVLPHRSFVRNRDRWFKACSELAAANITYRLLVGGDELIDHPLPVDELRAARFILNLDPQDLAPRDTAALEADGRSAQKFATAGQAVAGVKPAVKIQADGKVRLLPRVKPGSAVIHLLNYQYDPERDQVQIIKGAMLEVEPARLGLKSECACTLLAPGSAPLELQSSNGTVTIPELKDWAVLLFKAR
jgi:hypothetical protein